MNQLKHLAIIMDGNRRWARKRGVALFRGHQAGYQKLKQVGDWCLEAGIKFLTVYAFSSENWQRSKLEITYLIRLMLKVVKVDLDSLVKRNLRLKVIGRLEKFPTKLQQAVRDAEELTQHNEKGTLVVCLGYGGRQEIVDAIKKIIAQHKKPEEINENLIKKNLYYPELPEPDLIIRTGAVMRLSNFLTWQSIYSELCFTPTFWPDFSKSEFNRILREYKKRQRRFGK
jgi:undecaprenyl diphosphate synthase